MPEPGELILIYLDQVAAAYCWEEKLNLAKQPAVTQLVKELVIYMQELQDNYNDSNTTTTTGDKEEQSNTEDQPKSTGSEPNSNSEAKPGRTDVHSTHRSH
eukprot:s1368_g16.t1